MNKCLFTGRLTKDPTFKKKTNKMDAFVAFSIAVTNGYGDNERTFYLDCSTYGRLAEWISDNCYKGVKVLVEGVFYTYDSKYGNNKFCLDLKSCEIVQHTRAYIEENPQVLRDIDKHTSELLNEALLFTEKKKQTKVETWEDIEKMLEGEDYKKNNPELNSSIEQLPIYDMKGIGLPVDEDGFMVINEEDVELPFD